MSESTARCERKRRAALRAAGRCYYCRFPVRHRTLEGRPYAYCLSCREERAAMMKRYHQRRRRG